MRVVAEDGVRPPGLPGRSSRDASSVISVRRSALYGSESSTSRGTSAASPYQASRSAMASLQPSMSRCTYSAEPYCGSSAGSRASCWRKAGPWLQPPALASVQPFQSYVAGASYDADQPARSAAVRVPVWRLPLVSMVGRAA